MDDFVQFMFAIAAAIICLWLLPWVLYWLIRIMSGTYGAVAGAIGGSFQNASGQFAAWQSRNSILTQATRAVRGSRLRRESAAGKTDPEVYAIAALLTKAVSNCNMIHHYVADAI